MPQSFLQSLIGRLPLRAHPPAQRRRRRTAALTPRLECLETRCMLSGLTTMIDQGPASNRVDIVFLGDGYTADEIDSAYVQHIAGMLSHLFQNGQDPFPRYQNFFNVHRIDVVSAESGADAPPLGIFRNTALDATYYFDGTTQRLLYVNPSKANAALAQGLVGTSISADMQLVTVNDTRYGGGGGTYAVYAGGNSAAPEIALHELGHAFSHLADEYGGWGDYTGPEPHAANVTRAADGAKWSHWLGYDQPGIGVIGAYPGGQYYDTGIYRPSQTSKMRALDRPFDAVSREKIILDIYDLVDPLDAYRDNSQSIVAEQPPELWVDTIDPNIIQVEWSVNGAAVPGANGENFRLADHGFGNGTYTVTARAYDPTDWVRIHRDRLEQTVSWSITIDGPPPAPEILLPGPITTTPTFQWSAVPGATRYDLWVNDLTTGQSAVIRRQDLTTTTFTAPQPLGTRHHYIWTVRAFDADGRAGEWAPHVRFKLVDGGQVPVIQTPTLREYAFEDELKFTWTIIDGADHYDVWVNDVTAGVSGVLRNQHVVGTTLDASGQLPLNHHYIWTVRPVFADGTLGEWAQHARFKVVDRPGMPEIREIIREADTAPVQLTWTPAENADHYEVWVNNVTTRQSAVILDRNARTTNYVPSDPLPAGHEFMWTVRAVSTAGVPGQWVTARKFQTPVSLEAPKLQTPAGSTFGPVVTFSWEAVTGAARYDLWVSNLTTGRMQVLRRTDLVNTSFATLELAPGHSYIWSVRGIQADGGFGDWAPLRSFQVAAALTLGDLIDDDDVPFGPATDATRGIATIATDDSFTGAARF